MTKKRIIIDIIIISILGTLLHFTYEWSGNNAFVGVFSAVSESVWEHLKLLFWPVFLLSIIEYFLFERRNRCFLPARFIAVVTGMLTIVTLFYTISGVLGRNIDYINIAIYYIAVIVTFVISHIIEKNVSNKCRILLPLSFVGFIIIAFLFVIWTNNPPTLGIFAIPFSE